MILAALAVGCRANKLAIKPDLPSGQPSEEPEETRGRNVVVKLDQAVGTDLSHPGDLVTAHVAAPVVDHAGRLLVPEGALARGHVTHSQGGKGAAPPRLELVFDRLDWNGRSHPIHAVVASADVELKSPGADPEVAGRGRYAGALFGMIFLNLPGAVIGYHLGGAWGATAAVQERTAAARLPMGSFLTLRLLNR